MRGLSARQSIAVITLLLSLIIGHAIHYFQSRKKLPEVDPHILQKFTFVADSLDRADSLRRALGMPKSSINIDVNINTASREELEKLPGIGPVMARRILEFRERVGKISRKEQLLEVKGIGKKTLLKIEKFIHL